MPAYEIVNPTAAPDLIFVCDHASNAVPPEHGSLGLAKNLFGLHIAYDIGAADVTRAFAQAFNAPAILGAYSRLLIDLNRGADDPTLVMKLSDGAIIPGNAKADANEIRTRIATYYRPYHDAIEAQIARARAAERQTRPRLDPQLHARMERPKAPLAHRRPVGPQRRPPRPTAARRPARRRRHRRRRQRTLFRRTRGRLHGPARARARLRPRPDRDPPRPDR